MFLKMSSVKPDVRERCKTIGLYRTEAGFYRDLARECPIRVPRAYAVKYEPQTGESLLLLEEIGHCRFGDNVAGATVAEAQVVIANLARMQAHYWNHPQLAQCAWLRTAAEDSIDVPPLYRSLVPVWEQRWAAVAPAPLVKSIRVLGRQLEAWIATHSRGPLTLAHGDYRPDNFAFDGAGEQVLFDWQTARRYPASRDLAYFLAFAMPPEVRRQREDELLQFYHETLLANGVRDYSLDQVRVNHRRSLGSAIVTCVVAGALLDFSSERGQKLIDALIGRLGAALDDHDFVSWESPP
jgi:hypothetical protein